MAINITTDQGTRQAIAELAERLASVLLVADTAGLDVAPLMRELDQRLDALDQQAHERLS